MISVYVYWPPTFLSLCFVFKVQLGTLHGSAERRTRKMSYIEELIFVSQVMYILKDNMS